MSALEGFDWAGWLARRRQRHEVQTAAFARVLRGMRCFNDHASSGRWAEARAVLDEMREEST
jgi:hypothetical protein